MLKKSLASRPLRPAKTIGQSLFRLKDKKDASKFVDAIYKIGSLYVSLTEHVAVIDWDNVKVIEQEQNWQQCGIIKDIHTNPHLQQTTGGDVLPDVWDTLNATTTARTIAPPTSPRPG